MIIVLPGKVGLYIAERIFIMDKNEKYYPYSQYLKERYGEKNVGVVEEWIKIDALRLNAQQELDNLNREKNQLAELGKDPAKIEEVRQKARELKEKSETYNRSL